MNTVFYLAAGIAILATVMTITRWNAVHGLLYLIVSLLAVAVLFFTLGAPLVAALEVIVYAGAIMVLFIFVVMILNLAPEADTQERGWLTYRMMILPVLLALVLLVETIYAVWSVAGTHTGETYIPPREVSLALFGRYLIGVELASILLLVGLVVAYHLGRRALPVMREEDEREANEEAVIEHAA